MPHSVLIVDDSHVVRRVMRDFFERRTDWKIGGEAEDGEEAIQKAKQLKPDLILLDFSMPNMNGIEAASELKKILPDVHIIVFTMFGDALGSTLSSAVGVDLVIPKAEGLTVLVDAVQQLIGTSEPNRSKARADHQGPSATEQD
jgi:DNA-binding NarL/FixJ family response regulator